MSPTVTLNRADVEKLRAEARATLGRRLLPMNEYFALFARVDAALAQSATPAAAPTPDFETMSYDAIAQYCLRQLRGCATDEQYSDAFGKISRAVQFFHSRWTAAQAASAEREAELEDERNEATKAFENAWTLVRELQEKLAESERRREVAEKMLAEADTVIVDERGDSEFGLSLKCRAEFEKWYVEARARHDARAKETT